MGTQWSYRETLSGANRLRRSYYELLRDDLDQFLLDYALIDSFNNFLERKIDYPFVEKRELKPRARIPDVEYEHQNTFLVIFSEETIPAAQKKYIRFFDVNQTTKTNLLRSKTLPIRSRFNRTQKYIDSVHFFNFLHILLPMDYALLIQRDPHSGRRDRYALSHFHVRIDWPIADAAEDMARELRYISKDLYERGDRYAEDMQKKFFEYYGTSVMAGGRRTAAIVGSQYLKRNPGITTVYAGSSESRCLLRISERGVSKVVLMPFLSSEIKQIAETHHLSLSLFKKYYVVTRYKKRYVVLFQVAYTPTDYGRIPDDGRLRDLKPDLNWLTVDSQHLLPKPGTWRYPPLPMNVIYS